MKILPLLAMLATASFATPLFPDFSRDGVSIKGSPLIGASITSPGRYLFALEDQPCPFCDGDYNDVYGEITWFGSSLPIVSVFTQGGLGAYYNAGTAGFAGTLTADGDNLTLVFNTPSGQMFSGTNQVLIYKLADVPSTHMPEPSTYAAVGAGLLALGTIGSRRKTRW